MKPYINIHTHIFHLECVPRKFRGFMLPSFLYNRRIMKGITDMMRKVFSTSNDFLDKYANFFLISSRRSHSKLFEDLRSAAGQLPMNYVVLSLDMDKMEAGELISNYDTQISHLYEVKKKYPNEVLPFLSVDPRKNYPMGIRQFIEDNFTKYGFVGIKLYPSLGYYPFDPRLRPVYDFACEKDVPVMTHCTRAGVWYQGTIREEHTNPKNMNPNNLRDYKYSAFAHEKNKKFKDRFADPLNFLEVLSMSEYKNLKLCFGHYGGSDEMMKREKKGHNTKETNFYLAVKHLVERKEFNVYADISYSLSDIKKIGALLKKDLKDERLGKRIMFGTDFFLTLQENTEKKLIDNCIRSLSTTEFNQISIYNTREYLKSNYYKP